MRVDDDVHALLIGFWAALLGHAHRVALNGAQVAHVVRTQAHHFAARHRALPRAHDAAAVAVAVAVAQVATELDVDFFARDQGPAVAQIARTHLHIHLRHQHFWGAAIGQGDAFRHQPHDVAGELRHLCRRQGNARAQVVGLGVGDGTARIDVCVAIARGIST